MNVLARLLSGGGLMASTPPPDADFWYGPAPGAMTASGVAINADNAQNVSAWFRGRDILATVLAMIPFGMYERLPNDQGREAATGHPLHDVIHRKPNPWQDSFQWRRQAMYKLIDFGDSYHWIKPGTRGFADQLWPIDPTCVTVSLLESTGVRVYDIRDPKTGITRRFTQDDIFHLMGPSDDGVSGKKGILARARDSVGLSRALEGYSATTFSRGAMHGGVIKVQGVMKDEASKRMARSFMDATAGPNNWHMPVILEQGAEWKENTMTPEDAQMLDSRKFSVNDLARWLGIPPHMLGDLDRSTNNNIEQQAQEFTTFTEGPWFSLWEFATNDQLVLNPQRFYAEFNRDALVRGDIETRSEAQVKYVQAGILTRNEVRVTENRKKLPGLDEPLNPANITGSRAGAEPAPRTPKAAPSSGRAEAIVQESAARLLRKEVKAVQAMAVKHAADGDAFAAAVTEFYTKHAGLVAETLRLDARAADEYCASQAAQLLNGSWIAAIELWGEDAYAAGLAGLALEAA